MAVRNKRKLSLVAEESAEPGLQYGLEDAPPLPSALILGLQNFLPMFITQVTAVTVISGPLCLHDAVGQAQLISTCIFVAGIVTILQSYIGIRLPIIQGSSSAFYAPVFAILGLTKWKCSQEPGTNITATAIPDSATVTWRPANAANSSLEWRSRMCEIQGALIVASLFEMLLGFSGLLGIIMAYISPITIGVVITLIGLPLVPVAANQCGLSWPVAAGTLLLAILFSQYLKNVGIPFPGINQQRKCVITRHKIFLLFSLLLAVVPMWLLCLALTQTGVLSSQPGTWQYHSRTDTRAYVLRESPWVRLPYPFQWGLPTVSLSGAIGMMAAVLASAVESVGDYEACARLAKAPPPPIHAVNRGIGMEGVGVFLNGIFGTGMGTTSYSQNIAIISITKVGCRRVAFVAGCWMIVLGLFSKFGALFTTAPVPVIGAAFFFSLGNIISAGLSNFQFTDMNASRNLFVVGFSLSVAMALPNWVRANQDAINTGSSTADQVITVFLSTAPLLGGITAFILDNTLKKSASQLAKELGSRAGEAPTGETQDNLSYECPLAVCNREMRRPRWSWAAFVPFCTTFRGFHVCSACNCCKGQRRSRSFDLTTKY